MPRKQVFEWPFWAQVYAYGIAIPMSLASFGLIIWFITQRSNIFDTEFVGAILLMLAFLSSFLMSGVLFVWCAERVWHRKSEALSYASSAHLMSMLPAVFILVIGFVGEQKAFLNELTTFVRTGEWNIDALLLAWVILHTPFMAALALVDNTYRFAEDGDGDED